MFYLRLVYTLFLSFSFSMTQSIYNSYGLGLPKSTFYASENGLGSIGLVPNFTNKVSIGNPSTWLPIDTLLVKFGTRPIDPKPFSDA